MVFGRKNARRIADRDPAERHRRPGRQDGPQMHDGVDAHLGCAADPRTVEDGGARRDEGFALDDAAGEAGARADHHIFRDRDGVAANASDDGRIHDHAILADRHLAALGRYHGAEADRAIWADRHIPANHGVRRDARRCVDGRPRAAMFQDHLYRPCVMNTALDPPLATS
jgi:hypothetical protein